MEKKIKEYEKFIEKKTKEKLNPIERVKLMEYHREMVTNFQHERLIHLIIMLFFVAVSLGLLGILVWSLYSLGLVIEMLSFYILTGIVVIMTIFYVKHYYFLENHVQGLYKYTKTLRIGKDSGK